MPQPKFGPYSDFQDPYVVSQQLASKPANDSPDPAPSPDINSPYKGIWSALASVVGGLITNWFNYRNQQSVNSANAQLARQQNALNIAQWQRENSYNSPLAQIERLRAAGLNPGLLMSAGIENVAAQSPQMVSSQGRASANFANPFASFAQDINETRLAESQIKLNESAANRNNADAGLKESQITLNGIKIKYAGDLNEANIRLLDETTKKYSKEIEKMSSEIDLNKALEQLNNVKIEELKYKIENLYPAEVQKLAADAHLSKAQACEIYALMSYKQLLMSAQRGYYLSADFNQSQQGKLNMANARLANFLSTSPEYMQNIVNSMEYDTQTKYYQMNLTAGTSPFATTGPGDYGFIQTFAQACNGAMAMGGQLFTGVYRATP